MSDQRRQDERLVAALRFLAERAEPVPRKHVWEAASAEYPMTDTESSFVPSRPEPRGRNAFWFATSMLGRAGFLEKSGDGLWLITDEGRRVLDADPDPITFRKEAGRIARDNTKRLMADRAARLNIAIVPPDASAEHIREASLRFRERGLRQLSSVFAEHRSVWRADVTAELVHCFAEREEVDGTSFLDKLRVQFADASDDARLLMAELVAWQLLPLQSPGERKKRERVQALLDLMREPVLIPAELDQAFSSWSFNPGQGMAHGIHNVLSIVMRLVDQWVSLGEDERDALLDDPWAWREFVASVPGTPFPT